MKRHNQETINSILEITGSKRTSIVSLASTGSKKEKYLASRIKEKTRNEIVEKINDAYKSIHIPSALEIVLLLEQEYKYSKLRCSMRELKKDFSICTTDEEYLRLIRDLMLHVMSGMICNIAYEFDYFVEFMQRKTVQYFYDKTSHIDAKYVSNVIDNYLLE